MKINVFKIKANTPQRKIHKGFDSYVKSMEDLVSETIPESVAALHETSMFIPYETTFEKLNAALPIVKISEESEAPCLLSLRILCRNEYTHGLGLFLCRMIDEKLLPGKKMAFSFVRSLIFKFIIKPKEEYYILEFFLDVETAKDLQTIKKNLPRFEEEVRLTTLGVEHARKVVLAKGYNLEEKRMILLENFTSLLKSASDFDRKTLFSDVQELLLKGVHEEFPDKIPDHLLPYIDAKPKTFDHHIYNEVQHFSLLFQDSFSRLRSLSHLSKVISYLYLFRKMITHSVKIKPDQRHLSFKVIPFKLDKVPTLAFLLGVNLIQGYERLEESDLMSAIQKYLPDATLIPETTIINEESHKRVVTLYLELQRKDHSAFPTEMIKILRKKIPKELQNSLSHVKERLHIVDDETTRNILNLTKEIFSIHDPAKIVIQYHNQTPSHLYFTALLAHLQTPDAPPLAFSSEGPITIRKSERKVVGILKNRYIKEIYLYDIALQKENLDIKHGREKIFDFFKKRLHKLHDFNGGMIVRKYENLSDFKALLPLPYPDVIAENYFYSISPSYMQTLAEPHLLMKHFLMILPHLDNELFGEDPLVLIEESMILLISRDAYLGREIEKKVGNLPQGAFSTRIKKEEIYFLGYVFRKNKDASYFLSQIAHEKLTV